jgi:hypothetical protein
MKHGGSLTINPDTGLPEAGFLDKLLPSIIGAGISFFSGGTIDPATAAMIVGGVETARTGDIGKGISAGLGAYGGANLTTGLTEAGASTIGAAEAAKGLTMSPELLAEFGGDSAKDALLQQQVTERMAAATPYEKLSSGFDAFKNNPTGMARSLAMPAAMAFGPAILAGANVKNNMPQTVTKPGMIRPYSYFNGQYVAGNPYEAMPTRAAEGGLMGMNNGGYSPGQLDFTQQSEPVMRMAEGGIAGYAPGGYVPSDTEIFNYFKTPGGKTDAQIAADMQTYGVSAADIARATGTQGQEAGYNTRFVQAVAKPDTDTGEFMKAANAVGLQNQALANALQTSGLSQGAQYALTHQNIGPNANTAETQGGLEGLSSNINYLANLANTQIGSGTLTAAQARENALTEMNKYGLNEADVLRATGKTVAELFKDKAVVPPTCGFGMQLNAAKTACEPIICGTGFQLNKAGTACEAITKIDDKVVDDGKTCGPGFTKSIDGKSCVPIVATETPCPTGFHRDITTGKCVPNISATQNTTDTVDTSTSLVTAPATTLPVGVGGTTGPSIEGGGATINPNGTITVSPVIPGIPVGGFTGMESLRNAYTKGGGSLGYLSPTYTKDQFKTKYEDKLTGGSKQAYDYLTGKTKYSPVPYTEDGQIAKSYAESVMKMPVASSSKMYIFKNGKYEVNPDYAIPTYDKDGKKSSNLTNADVKTFMDKAPAADAFYTWATTNNLSPEQIALASGRPINEISKLYSGAKDLVGEDGKIDQTKVDEKAEADLKANFDYAAYLKANPDVQAELDAGKANFGSKDDLAAAAWEHYQRYGKAQNRALKAEGGLAALTMARGGISNPFFSKTTGKFTSRAPQVYAGGGMPEQFNLGGYSDGGRLLRGPGDGVSDSIPATIGDKRPARLADGEFVVPARIVSELGNGSTEAGARKLYAMMDRVQAARKGSIGKGKVANNSRADKYLPA